MLKDFNNLVKFLPNISYVPNSNDFGGKYRKIIKVLTIINAEQQILLELLFLPSKLLAKSYRIMDGDIFYYQAKAEISVLVVTAKAEPFFAIYWSRTVFNKLGFRLGTVFNPVVVLSTCQNNSIGKNSTELVNKLAGIYSTYAKYTEKI